MNGKENIINKILADAEQKCAEILATAESQAQEIADAARAAAVDEQQSLTRRLENLSAERQRNAIATADLESRKYKLSQKQRLISACYDKALVELTKLPEKKRLDVIGKIIAAYAEQGEKVRVAMPDKGIVTQKFLDTLNLGLTLSKQTVDACGGVVLCGAAYDKDLTFPKIVDYLREQTEAKVAVALFGENK